MKKITFRDIDEFLDFDLTKLADYHVRYYDLVKRGYHDEWIISSSNQASKPEKQSAKEMEQKKLK